MSSCPPARSEYWSPTLATMRYLVEVRSGTTVLQRLLTRKRTATFKSTPATGTLAVSVRAMSTRVPPGPAAKSSVKAPKRG